MVSKGTGQNCTSAQNCTKPNSQESTIKYKGTKLHEDDFARVNFARVTFLHESKKYRKKKQKKSYWPRVRVRGNSDSEEKKNKLPTEGKG